MFLQDLKVILYDSDIYYISFSHPADKGALGDSNIELWTLKLESQLAVWIKLAQNLALVSYLTVPFLPNLVWWTGFGLVHKNLNSISWQIWHALETRFHVKGFIYIS